MFDNVNKIDKVKKDQIEEIAKENAEKSGFVKLLRWNKPQILIYIGAIFAAFNGFIQPVSGVFMSKILTLMTVPSEYLIDKNDPSIKGVAYFKQEILYWVIAYAIVGCVILFTYFIAKKSFGTLGENVTLSVRKVLY